MGIYLNPGNRRYMISVNSQIYVDKTEMIGFINSVVNTNQRYVSVSRPRRFGKTMAADMLCAYYDRTADSRDLFEKRMIAGKTGWDRYLGKFDVIRLVMTDFLEGSGDVGEMLSYMTDEVTEELMAAYPDLHYGKRITLRTVMSKIFSATGCPFVVVIDEWDAIFRIWEDDKDGQTEYLNFLRDWLKDRTMWRWPI